MRSRTCRAGIAWSRDGAWLFYVTDDQERPYRVWRHAVERALRRRVLVFEEVDERYFVGVGETRSDDFVVIQSSSKTSSEMRLISTDEPTSDPVVVRAREDGIEYSVDHWGDLLIMHTNDDAVDFRLLAAPTDSDWADGRSWASSCRTSQDDGSSVPTRSGPSSSASGSTHSCTVAHPVP